MSESKNLELSPQAVRALAEISDRWKKASTKYMQTANIAFESGNTFAFQADAEARAAIYSHCADELRDFLSQNAAPIKGSPLVDAFAESKNDFSGPVILHMSHMSMRGDKP